MTDNEPGFSRIHARSRRQAMDWSLVLASQGIAATITPPSADAGWTLLVGAEDGTRAEQAIRLYQRENRGWAWRRPLPGDAAQFHWGSAIWCIFLALVYGLNVLAGNGLERAGILDAEKTQGGQWWRLFTAVMLHADVGHLAANLSIGLLVWGLAMARFGAGCALLAAYVAGVGGNVLGLLLRTKPYLGLGASGMVMGGVGLLTVESVWLWRQGPRAARYILSAVLAGFMLLVLYGFDPQADILAHLGGFFAGCALGCGLAFLPPRVVLSAEANLMATLGLSALVLVSWWLAVR